MKGIILIVALAAAGIWYMSSGSTETVMTPESVELAFQSFISEY